MFKSKPNNSKSKVDMHHIVPKGDATFQMMTNLCSQFYGVNPFLIGYYPPYVEAPSAPTFPNADSLLNWFENCGSGCLVYVIDLEQHYIVPAVLDEVAPSTDSEGHIDNGMRAVWCASHHYTEIDLYTGANYGTKWLASPVPFFPVQYAKQFNEANEMWDVDFQG